MLITHGKVASLCCFFGCITAPKKNYRWIDESIIEYIHDIIIPLYGQ